MGLSFDLISEFVKITNDKKESPKEGTVYATVVGGTGGKYVKIDGSDLLTPMETTTDIEDGERVTLMIKDHKAVVTGNVTNPSASTGKVDKVTDSINSVSDRVGTFELVVADKVSTNELEAYKATIEVLIAGKATIEDLTATNAKIENLEVKNAEIENLVAEKATIKDLEAVNATIDNLKVKDAEIENAVIKNLEATTADIKVLNADFAQIKTLVNGNLTSDNILSFNLTSGKVTVDDAFIKDAMIDTISAGKINAGEINTNLVSIGSEDGGMLITGSTQQFTDKNGNVRIQIGKDASGDFTFILYGEDGKGQLINQNGITASAIGDGLIVNDMVSDNAAISGGKLDISSVITEINGDTSTTIKSSKIYLNDQAQSLEVAFNSLKTKVDTIQEVTIQGDLTAIVEQVQSNTSKIEVNSENITTLISEDTVIKKQVTDLKGTVEKTETTLTSKYTSLNQSLEGFKTTVADTYATKSSVTDVVDNLNANYSTTSTMNSAIDQKVQEISASVSSTYATKNEVKTLDDNLKTNYSTTQQMESAINIAKEEINLGVSSVYETKENTTSKINGAVNSIRVGGTNLWVLSDLTDGYESQGNITSSTAQYKIRQTQIPTNNAKELVYQCWNPLGVTNNMNTNRVAFFDNNHNLISSTQVPKLNGDLYQWQLITIPTNSVYVRLAAICGSSDGVYEPSIKIKFEFGNKPTGYNLAPEDVIDDIQTAKHEAITSANNNTTTVIQNYYTKAQTDSQINVAKEAINLGVSTTYETKANVESKVSSSLDSAKSYADTKKTEAINSAASDASTKVNNAKTELNASIETKANSSDVYKKSEVYTRAQTDSQINVAKEEINLGVSDTYETKESTTSKIQNAVNDIQSDISTAKNEAIDSANDTLTTTIANYYTKAQTDSAINVAQDEINLGVSSTYETKADLSNKLTNYYTKTQINSEINIAKEAINLGVSNTYETKANVSNKFANYYTKTQTDSQINIAKNAIDLEVAKKVNSDSIISSINLSPESIRISSSKISIDGAVVINSINSTTSTSITGNKIRTGVISSNNNRIKFDLDDGYILAYDESGNLVGRTVSNKINNTTIYGMSSGAEADHYVAMSYKDNPSDITYSFGVVCTGTDGLGGTNLRRGVNIQAPMHINNITRVNGYLTWDGFTRSDGDKIEIYKTTASTESNLYLRLADDDKTNFKITCKHYIKGHMSIANFHYPNDSTGSVAGIDFFQSLDMHKWYIKNASGVATASLSADNLSLTSDTATVQSLSPVALMALDNDFNDIQQATKTQYIAASTQKQIIHTGTIEIGSDKIEYVELPEDFLMCVDIQIVASPNKLCKFAITNKDEYGFIIETDTENVAFDYVVTGTKMDGAILDLPEEEPQEYCINENDEMVPYVVEKKK